MSAHHPYDLLFEPVRIGPVTAPNRFYQVPLALGFDLGVRIEPNTVVVELAGVRFRREMPTL